jgi:hypothetical protein
MTESFEEDPWIAKNSQIAPEKLHALGVVAFRWNLAEFALKSLLIAVSDFEFFKIWAIIHEVGDLAISASILEIIEHKSFSTPIHDAIEHALKLYDANRINRNQLTHFVPLPLEESDLARMKGPNWNPQPFSDSVQDLRRVAEDIFNLFNYLVALNQILYAADHTVKPITSSEQSPPVPDTIPLPERLWKPLPPNPQKRKEQPGSSQG